MRAFGVVFLVACGGGQPTDDSEETEVVDDTAETELPVEPGPYVLLNHEDPCDDGSVIIPASGEEEHWALAVLTPPAYPFRVDSVIASFVDTTQGGTQCVGNLQHTVSLWVASSHTPAASPVPLYSDVSDAIDAGNDVWAVGLTLPDDALRLQEGDNLLVMSRWPGRRRT